MLAPIGYVPPVTYQQQYYCRRGPPVTSIRSQRVRSPANPVQFMIDDPVILDLNDRQARAVTPEVTCRLCGQVDTPDFCSTCGLPLGSIPSTLPWYLLDRLRTIVTPIPRFLLTTVLLLLRPTLFFEKLNAEGFGLHRLRVLSLSGLAVGSASFKHWRRPTAPQNYFLYVATLVALLPGLFDEETGSAVPSPLRLPVGLEIFAILLLFLVFRAYKWVLGVHDVRALIEYFLYVVSVLHLACLILWVLIVMQPGSRVLVYGPCSVIFLHAYYCIVVPWGLFPDLFSVSPHCVRRSMWLMFLFPSLWFPLLILVAWVFCR